MKKILAMKSMPLVMAVVAFMLGLPSLRLGLAMDDRWHRAMVLHDPRWIPAARAPWDLFTFVSGDSNERALILEKGIVPWWISEDLKVSFFRPIPSLLHALEYRFFPETPWLMHVDSLLWYAAVTALAAVLFRRVIGRAGMEPWIAGLAALIYAVDGTHGLPVGWLANRNALVAGAFGLGALLAHDMRRPFASASLLGLALGSGESATGILAYYAAHAMFLDERPRRERTRALLPAIVVIVAWAVIHRVGDYGVRGSNLYLDPMHEPAGFLGSVLDLPVLAGAELGAPTPDLYPFVTLPSKVILFAVAALACTCAVLSGLPLLRRSREARFFLAGGLLALLPSCSTIPAARLLTIASFGLVGFLAMVVMETSKLASRYTWWAVKARLVLSPIVFMVHLHQMAIMDHMVEGGAAGVPRTDDVKDKTLVLVNSPDTAFAYYVLVNRIERGEPSPVKMLTLAGGYRDVTITRVDERTLVVRVSEGFYRRGTDLLFRSLREVTPVGKQMGTSECLITTTHALPDGIIDEARYELAEPLESSHWLFMQQRGGALEPFRLPAIGETRILPGTPML